MIVSERVSERMLDLGMTQSELARRVGVKQPTIYKLLRTSKKGSTHLHKIARELGTTPAYLSGETDDPFEDAPAPPVLSCEEMEWVELFRRMDDGQRAAALTLLRPLVDPSPAPHPTMHKQGSFAMRKETT
ncbi:helix-turn-helix domain-containing protein [Sphingomonas sp. BK580]|uniref:helix-turn-helix domain-containing protein n=1 Tax=Sphingomonas sp. BK580 TaxID=2586972 RepID=UPI00160F3221|nr:helix-turn-helix transcriptional regulator [Sphingomonas sp. BK580]MBB3691475.1 transcriptional regulator with XRE-family HTH domain [Sphingomonas sp. BK580]